MKKYKVTKEFQFLSSDKKIIVLKVGTIIENFKYVLKNEDFLIDQEIILNNPDFFTELDWKVELLAYMKTNKIPQPAILSKKMIPFIEDMIINNQSTQVDNINPHLEEEIEIRLKRVEKKEIDLKEDLKKLDEKEDRYRSMMNELNKRESDLSDKERKLELLIVEKSSTDDKYSEINKKIEEDLKTLKEREIELDNREEYINNNEKIISEHLKELRNLDSEIKEWESKHWKMKRNTPPPSAIN